MMGKPSTTVAGSLTLVITYATLTPALSAWNKLEWRSLLVGRDSEMSNCFRGRERAAVVMGRRGTVLLSNAG